MIKESGKIVRKGGERIWVVLELLGQMGARALVMVIHLRAIRRSWAARSEGTPQAVDLVTTGSPLDNVGPVPEELRRDPFPGGSVPWSIVEAEKEQSRNRELMIWKAAIAVSWTVSAVAVIRSLWMF